MTRGKGDEVTEPIGSFAQAQALAAQYLPSDWYVSPDGYEFGGGYIVFGARIAFWYPTLLGGESHVFRVGCDGSVLDTQYQHLIGDMRRGHRVGAGPMSTRTSTAKTNTTSLDGDE